MTTYEFDFTKKKRKVKIMCRKTVRSLIAILVVLAMFQTTAFATTEDTTKKKVTLPKTPTELSATCGKQTNNVKVTWKKVSGVTGYYLYRSTNGKLPKKVYKNFKGSDRVAFTDKNVSGATYSYWIRSYKGDKLSEVSKPDTIKVNPFLTMKVRKISWAAKIKKTSKVYLTNTGSKRGKTIKKGTIVKVTKKYPKKVPAWHFPNRVYVQHIKNGKVLAKGWVKWSTVGNVYGKVSYDKKRKKVLDWTEAVKENYVNKKGYSSSTKYLIWTNTYTQRVNIFKGKKRKWKLYKTFRCSTGAYSQPCVIKSTFYLSGHKPKRVRFSEWSKKEYYYKYLTYYDGGLNAFHSTSWRVGTNKVINRVSPVAQPRTKACIRVTVKNAKYIYNKMPLGTRVVIF